MSLDVLGPAEIADMFDVHPVTVDRWRREGVLPLADAQLRRGPLWLRSTIVKWATDTGREQVIPQGGSK
jgi:predicted site-specific integrase-resolvase